MNGNRHPSLVPVPQERVRRADHVRVIHPNCHDPRALNLNPISGPAESGQQPFTAPTHARRTSALFTVAYSPKAVSCHQRNARTRVCASWWQAPPTRGARPREDRRQQDQSRLGLFGASRVSQDYSRPTTHCACRSCVRYFFYISLLACTTHGKATGKHTRLSAHHHPRSKLKPAFPPTPPYLHQPLKRPARTGLLLNQNHRSRPPL